MVIGGELPAEGMLIGEFHYKIGAKRRVALPAKFREVLGLRVVVTRGYEGCLVIVSPAQWSQLVEGAATGPFVAEAVRDTSRFLLGGASEVELDDQGRFVLPESLASHAGIEGVESEVCFLGLGRWVELWSKPVWQKRLVYLEKHGGEIGEKLARLTI